MVALLLQARHPESRERRASPASYAFRCDNETMGFSGMKEKRTGKSSVTARPTDAAFWKKARVVIPKTKQTITIGLDADLLDWLRKQKGYQTLINAVLRTYMEAKRG